MCYKSTTFDECRCGKKWNQKITYDPCEDVDMDRYGLCEMGVEDRDVSQASECGVCRKEREEKEREEHEDKGKHVHFDHWVSVIPRDDDE
jgi:hypothetical protein